MRLIETLSPDDLEQLLEEASQDRNLGAALKIISEKKRREKEYNRDFEMDLME